MTNFILYYAISNFCYLWTHQPTAEAHTYRNINMNVNIFFFFQNCPAHHNVLPIYVFCQYPNSDYEKES